MPSQDRSFRKSASRLAEPLVLFPVIAILLLIAVWGSTYSLLAIERDAVQRSAAASSVELLGTFEAQTLRRIREIDQTLRFVKFVYARDGDRIDLGDLGAKGLLFSDPAFTVAIIDNDGRVMASTRKVPTGFSGEQYFKESPGGDSLMISRASRGPDGQWMLHFGRHLFASSGAIQGVVTVTVRAGYFVDAYDRAKLGSQGVLAIVGSDGRFRVRRSGDALRFDGVVGGDEIAAASTSGQPTVAESSWDRVRRYTAARELLVYPLAVVVGLAESEQLEALGRHAETYIWRSAWATLAIIVVVGGLGFLAWQLGRSRRNAHRVLTAIESSVNAILITVMQNGNRVVEYANPAFERITGYTTDEALGRSTDFLLGDDTEQAATEEIRHAIADRRDGHVVLRNYRKDGSLFWNDLYIAPVHDGRGEVTHFVEVMNDVTEAKTFEQQLAHQANFDTLTGLANRNLLQDRLRQAIAIARRDGGIIGVLFLDIDNFKVVNDSLGHRVGDELLQEIASRLEKCVRDTDTVARLGGDEFVMVLRASVDAPDPAVGAFAAFVERLSATVAAPMTLAQRPIRPTCSIGISLYPQDGEDVETLLRHADAAMYRAKELGRNRFQFFTREVHEQIQQRLELHSSLRLALERDEFELRYQPQVSLETGEIVAVEALLRWRHPVKGLVGPGEFIAYAEETGLIVPIGAWVIREACLQAKRWQDIGLPRIRVAVNTSAKQCEHPETANYVRDALQKSQLDPQYLELEITESVSMNDPAQGVAMLERLKETGVTLSIDDFGTGFSNLSYLRRFPIDRLKIDHSFVRDITTDAGCLAIAQAIITMAHSLRLQVIAEGVETAEQLAVLRANGCDVIQGHYFAPPVPPASVWELLERKQRLHPNDLRKMVRRVV